MPNYTHDSERWLRSNAALYQRRGNQQMARNFELCAEDVKALRSENDTLRKESEFYREQCDMRDKRRDEVEGELAALRDAARPIAQFWKGGGVQGVVRGTNPPLEEKYLDALAALVGEDG